MLIRADSGGGTHDFLTWLTRPGRRLQYSVGFTITDDIHDAILKVPARAWTPAYDATGRSATARGSPSSPACSTCPSWPKGMRVIVRKERPHPGAQLRFTDIDGHRFTCFATSTKRGQLADLELRHRRRARCEDRIRCAKDTGLRNLPLHGYAQNQIWSEIVALACELLGLDGHARPDRHRPPLGTQTAAAAPVLRRRADRPRRPPPPAADLQPMALDHPDHRRHHPAPRPGTRLTSPSHPRRPGKEHHQRDRGTRPPGATAGPPGTTRPRKRPASRQPQATKPRSRKIEAKAPISTHNHPRHPVNWLPHARPDWRGLPPEALLLSRRWRQRGLRCRLTQTRLVRYH